MSDVFDGWTAAKGLWGILMTGVGYLTVRQSNRIDALEEKSVKREDHEKEVALIRAEHQRSIDDVKTMVRDLRQETSNNFTRVFDRLDTIADSIK